MRQRIIVGIISLFIMGLSAFSQDIKMEVVKDEWQVIPLFATNEKGEAVTDLKKANVEFLLNGQNSREFLLFKKPFILSGSRSEDEKIYSEAPGLKRGRVIILLFDTLFAGKKSLAVFTDIARRIVLQAEKNIKFLVVTTESTAIAISTDVPQTNKNDILKKIKNKVVPGPGYLYNPDVKAELYSRCFERTYRSIKNIKQNKFLYIFTSGIGVQDWQDYKNRAALYLEQSNGVLFFINPVNVNTTTGDENIRQLSQACGGKYITGSKSGIINKIENLHRAYYEIIIPGLKEFKGSLRRVSISSTRQKAAFHTAKRVSKTTARDTKTTLAGQGQQSQSALKEKHENRERIIIKTPAAAKTGQEKEIAGVLDLLSENRFNLERATSKFICGQAEIYLKQGRIQRALEELRSILRTPETNTGFIQSSIERLHKLLEQENKVENVLKDVVSARKNSNYKGILRLQDKVTEMIAKGKGSGELKETVNTILREMEKIVTRAREQTGFVEESFNQLAHHLEILEIKGKDSTNDSKAARYGKILAAVEKKFVGALQDTNSYKNEIKKILTHLKSAVGESEDHINFLKQALQELSKIDAAACSDFVIRSSDQFSLTFKKPFYTTKLLHLAAEPGLLSNPAFINVVCHTDNFHKNNKGYWEGFFSNDTVMIYIPAGKFTMGLPWESGGAQDESPAHELFLTGYWIAKYETTFKQFDHFCRMNKRRRPVDSDFGRKNHPVINVSWPDTADYCKWLANSTGLDFRLPTEAEWEKAARGRAGWKFPWGNANPNGQRANFADGDLYKKYSRSHPAEAQKGNLKWMDKNSHDGYAATAPVGKYPGGASPYGVMDMAGNVWEFVHDWYDGDYYQRSPAKNPPGAGETGYKVIRGGGWDSHHWMLRSTTRAGGVPGRTSDVVGFRVAIGPNTVGDGSQ